MFASSTGSALDYGNLYHRVLKPAMRAAGIEHGGWHRLRHTAATRLIESGARPDQAQRWLGHHDAAFTMRTYVHPAEDDLPDPDEVWADSLPTIRSSSPVKGHTPEGDVANLASSAATGTVCN